MAEEFVLGWTRISWGGGRFGGPDLGVKEKLTLGLWRGDAGTVGSCTNVPASEKPLKTTMQIRRYFHLDGATGARARHQEEKKHEPADEKSKKQ